jgi:hypothetical protein
MLSMSMLTSMYKLSMPWVYSVSTFQWVYSLRACSLSVRELPAPENKHKWMIDKRDWYFWEKNLIYYFFLSFLMFDHLSYIIWRSVFIQKELTHFVSSFKKGEVTYNIFWNENWRDPFLHIYTVHWKDIILTFSSRCS